MKSQRKKPAKKRTLLTDASVSQALNQAAHDAVEAHRRAGLPLVDWRNGKVVLVPAGDSRPIPKRRRSRH